MRVLLLSVVIVFCSASFVLAQSNKPQPKPTPQESTVDSQSANVDSNITQDEINKLPIIIRQPQITLQHALKIAERYATKHRINLSGHFLFEARMTQYGSEQGPKELRWFFHWMAAAAGRASVEIMVSMEGKAALPPSM